MSNHSYLQTDWTLEALKAYGFPRFRTYATWAVVEGHRLCSILAKCPTLRGTVLERANVIANPQQLWAIKSSVGGRCEYVAGNMFEEIPKADAYLMKNDLARLE